MLDNIYDIQSLEKVLSYIWTFENESSSCHGIFV